MWLEEGKNTKYKCFSIGFRMQKEKIDNQLI